MSSPAEGGRIALGREWLTGLMSSLTVADQWPARVGVVPTLGCRFAALAPWAACASRTALSEGWEVERMSKPLGKALLK